MPRNLERKLWKTARRRGYPMKQAVVYVYGTMKYLAARRKGDGEYGRTDEESYVES